MPSSDRRSGSGTRTGATTDERAPLIPVLARHVRQVESRANRGRVGPKDRTRFQVIALLMRSERARIKEDPELPEAARKELLKRIEGIGTILAHTAARDTSLLSLLGEDVRPGLAARELRRVWLEEAGLAAPEEPEEPQRGPVVPAELAQKQVVPQSVIARVRSNPFLAPDLAPREAERPRGRLLGWDLMDPLYRAFEEGAGGTTASMNLPEPLRPDQFAPPGTHLMPHQARLLEAVRRGHRTFLLADEPGLGKTAQALIAATVADAYPMLAVVPNVVKINWAREVGLWTPHRRVTVIHGDGEDMDAFADVFVVNYEILDRHLSWAATLGFRSMVVDEAHFIKNLTSQRSRHVLALAEQIRARTRDPLLMALTGTPLINDVEDFRAIWRYLGWIVGDQPAPALVRRLEDIGLTPADHDFYPAARDAVISMGIVRRRKADVAADLPSKRVVDLPVELEDAVGRSVRKAERALARRLVTKYRALLEAREAPAGTVDPDLMRRVALAELESGGSRSTENVFTMVRRIGQGKAALAADYAAQLARSAGKVAFFAKHIDVMDTAEQVIADAGLTTVSIRGEQSAKQRQHAIDAFQKDPAVAVAVCSLTAAGVGLNLHAASNVVLAELSWTAAEQEQAIDRVHRIGQEEPVTAWRILAAHTIDSKIAELIDSKQGLAARALDGSDVEVGSGDSVQLDALLHLLREALGA